MKFVSPGIFSCNKRTIHYNDGSYILSKGATRLVANDRKRLDELLAIHTSPETLLSVKRYGQNSLLN